MVLGWCRGAPSPALPSLIDAELPDMRAALRDALTRDRGFWNSTMLADLALLEALARKTLDAQVMQTIAGGYRDSAERGTPRERASVQEQLDFIAAMAMQPEPQIHAWLQQLQDAIAGKPGRSGPDASVARPASGQRMKTKAATARGKPRARRSRKTRSGK
jgi:hypothetical protein